jgi:ketosteroid isomerase-like protein
MSQENVRTIRAIFEALNAGDLERMGTMYADDVVVDMSESIGPDRGVYRGRDRAGAMWSDSVAQWDVFTWEAERVTEVPPDTVVVANRVRGRGAGSGVEVDARVGQVWRLSGGLVTYVKLFQTEAEALEAAGADG